MDPLLLETALALRSNATAYHLGRALADAANGRAVLEIADEEFDVLEFAWQGGCEARPLPGVHSQIGARWHRRGALADEQRSSAHRVRWEGQDFDVVRAVFVSGFKQTVVHWVVGDDAAAVSRFATAVSDAIHVPSHSVLVFSGSCWSRDRQLYQAVQLASWDDLVVPGDLAARIRGDVTSFLAARELYARFGVPYKRGVLLTGPPGNGKTHYVRALMKDAAIPVVYVKSFEARYGETEANIAAVFDRARRLAPCLLVLEDIDALVAPQHLSAFLNELDGVRADTGILTVATSNHPERLDPALLERPSRFDRKYHFDLPGPSERGRYLQRWNGRLEAAMQIDDAAIATLADRTEGFSYAYLKELVVSAMMRWMLEQRPGAMAALLATELDHLRAQQRPASSAT